MTIDETLGPLSRLAIIMNRYRLGALTRDCEEVEIAAFRVKSLLHYIDGNWWRYGD